MLATLIIVFREVLEAALIVGIVMAATKGVAGRGRWVATGVGAGVLGAGTVAIFGQALASMAEGVGQELFNAAVLFAAVAMLAWHNIWMGRHGRAIAAEMGAVGRAVVAGHRPLYALAIVVAVAVLREGSEVVLFLYGIAISEGADGWGMILGGILGLAGGAILGLALYLGLLRIPTRHLFAATSWMILLLAAGMAAQGADFLVRADLLPPLGKAIWDTTGLLSDRDVLGRILHTLIGYTASPSGIEIAFYMGTIIVIATLMKLLGQQPKPRPIATPSRVSLLAVALSAALAANLLPRHAKADFEVFSPVVTKGEAEFEFQGFVTKDKDPTKRNERNYEYELGYGVTDNWKFEFGYELEREPGDRLRSHAFEFENTFQLLPTGKYWLDFGMFLKYEKAFLTDVADEVTFGPLVEKSFGNLTTTINALFPSPIGSKAEGGTEFQYGVHTRYRIFPELEPGFQAFGNIGEVTHSSPLNQQDHRVGPAVNGAFKFNIGAQPLTLKYIGSLLFGLTDATPSRTYKWILELETPLPF